MCRRVWRVPCEPSWGRWATQSVQSLRSSAPRRFPANTCVTHQILRFRMHEIVSQLFLLAEKASFNYTFACIHSQEWCGPYPQVVKAEDGACCTSVPCWHVWEFRPHCSTSSMCCRQRGWLGNPKIGYWPRIVCLSRPQLFVRKAMQRWICLRFRPRWLRIPPALRRGGRKQPACHTCINALNKTEYKCKTTIFLRRVKNLSNSVKHILYSIYDCNLLRRGCHFITPLKISLQRWQKNGNMVSAPATVEPAVVFSAAPHVRSTRQLKGLGNLAFSMDCWPASFPALVECSWEGRSGRGTTLRDLISRMQASPACVHHVSSARTPTRPKIGRNSKELLQDYCAFSSALSQRIKNLYR